jgi:hypothetical protein
MRGDEQRLSGAICVTVIFPLCDESVRVREHLQCALSAVVFGSGSALLRTGVGQCRL